MESKNTMFAIWIVAIGLGLFVGWLIWGNRAMGPGMRRMSGGMMMQNDDMMHGDMDDTMDGMMAGLQGKTGDAFDQAFIDEMVVHHQGAVAMAELVLKTSKRPELIKLANDIITAQNGEIKMMQGWKSVWFK